MPARKHISKRSATNSHSLGEGKLSAANSSSKPKFIRCCDRRPASSTPKAVRAGLAFNANVLFFDRKPAAQKPWNQVEVVRLSSVPFPSSVTLLRRCAGYLMPQHRLTLRSHLHCPRPSL